MQLFPGLLLSVKPHTKYTEGEPEGSANSSYECGYKPGLLDEALDAHRPLVAHIVGGAAHAGASPVIGGYLYFVVHARHQVVHDQAVRGGVGRDVTVKLGLVPHHKNLYRKK